MIAYCDFIKMVESVSS